MWLSLLTRRIASSNTLQAACSIVKRWGAKKIVVIATIASREGLDKLQEAHPDVDVFVAQVDDKLSEGGMILPGIGDAGDRLFGTPADSMPRKETLDSLIVLDYSMNSYALIAFNSCIK